MIQINRKQALQRLELLPENLKDALFSETNAEIIWKAGSSEHLSEDKVAIFGKLVGYVILGFIHIGDLAEEIRVALNLNPEIVNTIVSEVNRKIFAPFKEELEKIYQSSVPESEEPEEEEAPVLDLRKKTEEPSFKIVEDEGQKQENKIDLSKEIKKESVVVPQAEPIIEKVVPAVEKIKEKEEKKAEEPKVELEAISFETPAPAAPEEPSKEEGPLIIHQEVGFKPLSGKLKSLGGMFNFLRSKDEFKKEKEPVKVELEIGEGFKAAKDEKEEEKNKEEYKPQIKTEEPVKGVNYSEMAAPENLPATKEDFKEIKSGAEPKNKVEEKKPEAENKGESEETIDLGKF